MCTLFLLHICRGSSRRNMQLTAPNISSKMSAGGTKRTFTFDMEAAIFQSGYTHRRMKISNAML